MGGWEGGGGRAGCIDEDGWDEADGQCCYTEHYPSPSAQQVVMNMVIMVGIDELLL